MSIAFVFIFRHWASCSIPIDGHFRLSQSRVNPPALPLCLHTPHILEPTPRAHTIPLLGLLSAVPKSPQPRSNPQKIPCLTK